jgi:hypothetical protein
MLTNQFTIDPSAVTLEEVCVGKSGDLALLTATAKNNRSTRVLKLVQNRFASKLTCIPTFASIQQICKHWVSSLGHDPDDELEVLERNIQVSQLKATLMYLSNVLNQKGFITNRTVVASMDIGKVNDITAILVAAAMGSWHIDEEAKDCPSKGPEEIVDVATTAAVPVAAAIPAVVSKEAK